MVRRGIEFPPPYGHELPLPSDIMDDSFKLVANRLRILWGMIYQLPKEKRQFLTEKLVNRFFNTLNEYEQNWLEGDDPRWKKPRAVLLKENAIQHVKRGEFVKLVGEGNQKTLEEFRKWIEEIE